MPGTHYSRATPSSNPAPLGTYSWACHPQWAGLAANPSPKYYPSVDNVSRYGFAPLLKLLYFEHLLYATEKAMAPHTSTLAWKIPWMEEPGRLQSMGLLKVGHDFTFTFTFHFHALKKEMATHSSVLAWSIPGMEEPGGLPSMGLHRVRHN